MTAISPSAFFQGLTTFVSQARGQLWCNIPQQGNLHTGIVNEAGGKIADVSVGMDLLRHGLRTKSFTIPGQSFSTITPLSFSGPERSVAYQPIFTDLNVEFYLIGKTMVEARSLYLTLRAWQSHIAGPVRSGNERQVGPTPDVTRFGVSYYDDCVCDMDAHVYGPDSTADNQSIHVKFYKAYPKSLGDIQVSWENPDAPITLSASFAYFYNEPQ